MTNYNPTQLLTRKLAAEFLGVQENTLAVWATNKRYKLPFYKVGRLVKYKISDLETPIPDKLSSFNSFKAYDFFAEEFLVVV